MKTRILFAGILFACTLFSCQRSDNPGQQRASRIRRNKGDILVAAASPWAEKRNLLWEGLDLACEEVNEDGGVLGRKIKILPFDDGRNLNQGQLAAYSISENELISAVIGHSASFISNPNSLIYQYYGILMLSPLSTNKKMTAQGFNLVFRNIPTDGIFGKTAATYCSKRDWKRVIVYYDNNDYGESLSNMFEQQCIEEDIVVVDRISYDSFSGSRDHRNTISYWKKNFDFDAIFLAGTVPNAAEIVKIFKEEMPDLPIIGGDGLDHPMLLKIAGSKAEGVYAVSIFDNDSTYPAYLKFKRSFNRAYQQEPDQAALQGYDAFMVLVEGMKLAGSAEPEKIAASLKKIQKWEGPAGPYRFDKNGDVVDKGVIVRVVKDGVYKKVDL
jgi:branched-chain amino acid transport system substrate-binding protein